MNTNGNYKLLLTTENVYQVLLYSQLLQIPNAISQCREFIADLYLSDRRLRNSLIPNKLGVKSNENDAIPVFDVHTTPSCSQTMSSGNIIKPIPNRISRGTAQIYEETGSLNSMSHGDLNDLWKPWIQQYHQRLCFPSNIREPDNSPLSIFYEKDRRVSSTVSSPEIFGKRNLSNNEGGRSFPFSDIGPNFQCASNIFPETLRVTNPYFAAAATAAAIRSSSKYIPASTSATLHKVSEEKASNKPRNKRRQENKGPDKSYLPQNGRYKAMNDVELDKLDVRNKIDRSRISLSSKLSSMPISKDDEDELPLLQPSNVVEDTNLNFLKFHSLLQTRNNNSCKELFSLPNLVPKPMVLQKKENEREYNLHRSIQEGSFKQLKEYSEESEKANEAFSNLDVAACDGPVKFHKVLNSMSGVVGSELRSSNTLKCKQSVIETEPHEDDHGRQLDANNENLTGEIYECPYCSHIFKSHYCYQKHKRRHIHPFTTDFCANNDKLDHAHLQSIEDGSNSANVFSCIKEDHTIKCRGSRENDAGKANVLRDINVQFFPCKICGAKFPSYYFVHKHKKLWHADEVNSQDDTSTSQEESLHLPNAKNKIEKLSTSSYRDTLQNSEHKKGTANLEIQKEIAMKSITRKYSYDHILISDQNKVASKKDGNTDVLYSPKKKMKLE
jgi:hypothetical protein